MQKTERVTDEMVEVGAKKLYEMRHLTRWEHATEQEQDFCRVEARAMLRTVAALSSAEEKAVEVKKLTKTQIETLANNIHNVNEYAYTVECLTYHLGAAALVAVPAVESEPVAIYRGNGLIDCGDAGHHNIELLKLIPAGSKLYAHPPRSSLQSAEGEIAEKARTLASAILANYGGMEDGDGNEAPELAMARDILALHTPPSPYGGDNGGDSATGTKDTDHG